MREKEIKEEKMVVGVRLRERERERERERVENWEWIRVDKRVSERRGKIE